jgi:phage tail protein X
MSAANETETPLSVPPETEAARTGSIETNLPAGISEPDDDLPALGSVPVAPGDTLGELAQAIYGAYTYRYHQALLGANPILDDPDSLIAGQALVFPAIAANTETLPDMTWWVVVAREADLGAAAAKLREETAKGLPRRLLALRSRGEDLSFRIVLNTCFESEEAATVAMEKLEGRISTVPEIFFLKKDGAILYGSLRFPDPSPVRGADNNGLLFTEETDT